MRSNLAPNPHTRHVYTTPKCSGAFEKLVVSSEWLNTIFEGDGHFALNGEIGRKKVEIFLYLYFDVSEIIIVVGTFRND